jgi:hypothetical protein
MGTQSTALVLDARMGIDGFTDSDFVEDGVTEKAIVAGET